MNSAARSFTDWPGLRNSALPKISQPVISEARLPDQRRVADGCNHVFDVLFCMAGNLIGQCRAFKDSVRPGARRAPKGAHPRERNDH
jgi:hypothetical protein